MWISGAYARCCESFIHARQVDAKFWGMVRDAPSGVRPAIYLKYKVALGTFLN